jgi:hypothetical protein
MNAFISYDFASMYRGIFLPFTNDAFGPELATLLLLLALLVLLIFLFATVPKAFRLRSALATINGKVGTGAESQNRALFQNNYSTIDTTLLSQSKTPGRNFARH